MMIFYRMMKILVLKAIQSGYVGNFLFLIHNNLLFQPINEIPFFDSLILSNSIQQILYVFENELFSLDITHFIDYIETSNVQLFTLLNRVYQ